MIQALVVDDEINIAEDLVFQLNERQEWQAEFCCDATAVLGLLNHNSVDVCFLDIEMPGQSGIMLAHSIQEKYPDIVLIFATAFAEHAAKAYRLPATDYLVKPISRKLLNEACQRVETKVKNGSVHPEKNSFDSAAESIAVKSMGRTDYVKISEIMIGQAAGNYVRLHCEEKEYLHRCSFTELNQQLAESGFLRCHRSYFVNSRKVVSFVRNMNDGDELILENGARAPVSHSYRKAVNEMLSGE